MLTVCLQSESEEQALVQSVLQLPPFALAGRFPQVDASPQELQQHVGLAGVGLGGVGVGAGAGVGAGDGVGAGAGVGAGVGGGGPSAVMVTSPQLAQTCEVSSQSHLQ